jgi:hypothetical protein
MIERVQGRLPALDARFLDEVRDQAVVRLPLFVDVEHALAADLTVERHWGDVRELRSPFRPPEQREWIANRRRTGAARVGLMRQAVGVGAVAHGEEMIGAPPACGSCRNRSSRTRDRCRRVAEN